MRTLYEKLKRSYKEKFYYSQKDNWDFLALRYMKNCKNILDIGCGVGRFISKDPKRIIGIDHSRDSIKICKENGFNVKFGEVTRFPFKDNSFDAIHCSHVIEHLLPLEVYDLLKEVNRVLKKGGIFCLRTPLLHKGFYYDLTHIKPYYPDAILHYLKEKDTDQITLDSIDGLYKKVALKYRRAQLFIEIYKTPFFILEPFFNFLYRLGISSFKKTGYMLVLKKIR